MRRRASSSTRSTGRTTTRNWRRSGRPGSSPRHDAATEIGTGAALPSRRGPMTTRVDSRSWLVAPAAALLLVVFVYPVFWLLLRSFSDPTWGFQNFRILIERPVYLRALGNTVVVSGTVTIVCLLLGYPLAYTIANAGPRL